MTPYSSAHRTMAACAALVLTVLGFQQVLLVPPAQAALLVAPLA